MQDLSESNEHDDESPRFLPAFTSAYVPASKVERMMITRDLQFAFSTAMNDIQNVAARTIALLQELAAELDRKEAQENASTLAPHD